MSGALAWFARNRVAANLLMFLFFWIGILGALGVRKEMFPTVTLDVVSVQVPYPGATPQEVEEGILIRIEEAIADLDGIDELDSTAFEGLGMVTVKVRSDYETRKLLDDVKTRVGAIFTFPEDAEEPIIEELTLKVHVISVALSSDTADEATLRRMGESVREDLLRLPGITQVKLGGSRPYEIGIHVSEETLRRHGLTFDYVAAAVRNSSLNLPAGSIRAGSGDILIRTQEQAYVGREFENLVLLTRPDGTRLRLRDVATVVDGFKEDELELRFDDRRAVMLSVMATGRENAPDVAARIKEYIRKTEPTLPAGVHLDVWFDFSRFYNERQELMVRNGLSGLLLVFLCLALFLRLRLALWVAVGVAVAFFGTFAVLWWANTSINMISMAAFILVLGILVDDGIVVAESIHSRQAGGSPGEEGAVAGVTAVGGPVLAGVLTTIIAFMPMFFISGVDGKIWRVIPTVIVPCLLFSLVESLLVLPAHLSHQPHPGISWYLFPIWPVVWLFERLQVIVDRLLQTFIRWGYRPLLEVTLSWRYATLGGFLALMILVVGLLLGGRVKSSFFPRFPGDVAVATIEMPTGTSAEVTRPVLERIQQVARQLREELDGQGQSPPVVKHVLVALGEHPVGQARDPVGRSGTSAGGTHLAEVTMEFENLEARGLSSEVIADRWRKLVGTVPGVRRLTIDASEGDDNKDIHLRMSSENADHIDAVGEELKAILRTYAGVYEINDTLGSRRPEITLKMKPAGETLGLRGLDLARQVRQAFYGEEAQRIQRGRDDIRVMVRYPHDQRRSLADLDNLRIRTASGDEVPLAEVAQLQYDLGPATIRRSDRQRMVDVTALLDRAVTPNPDGIMADLKKGFFAELPQRYPGMTWTREGGMKDQERVLRELGTGFVVALFAMYALMAIQFKSYIQPVLIAVAIPFGFVGAVGGHVILGETFSIISFLGLVALAGVAVNDSIVLIDTTNQLVREGIPVRRAVHLAAPQRFRAIMLTSLTTFLGLMPLMSETSLQAKFIVPMAVTLAFGVVFATLITLLLVPSLYLMIEDVRNLPKLFRRRQRPQQEAAAPPVNACQVAAEDVAAEEVAA